MEYGRDSQSMFCRALGLCDAYRMVPQRTKKLFAQSIFYTTHIQVSFDDGIMSDSGLKQKFNKVLLVNFSYKMKEEIPHFNSELFGLLPFIASGKIT